MPTIAIGCQPIASGKDASNWVAALPATIYYDFVHYEGAFVICPFASGTTNWSLTTHLQFCLTEYLLCLTMEKPLHYLLWRSSFIVKHNKFHNHMANFLIEECHNVTINPTVKTDTPIRLHECNHYNRRLQLEATRNSTRLNITNIGSRGFSACRPA